MQHNVSICVRAGLPKPRLVPDTERTKDTKTLDYASTPLDANTLLPAVLSTATTIRTSIVAIINSQFVFRVNCFLSPNFFK